MVCSHLCSGMEEKVKSTLSMCKLRKTLATRVESQINFYIFISNHAELRLQLWVEIPAI